MFSPHSYEIDTTTSTYALSSSQPHQTPTVVFLHGRMSEGRHFAACGEMLVQQWYRVVLFDLPGFGKSSEPTTPWTIIDYSHRLTKMLRHLSEQHQAGEYVLICHSFGGRVGLQALADHDSFASHHTKKLILLASGGLNTPTRTKVAGAVKHITTSLRSLGRAGRKIHSALHAAAKPFYSSDYKQVSPMMQQIFTQTVKYDQHSLLPHISIPTLIIRGDKDDQAPVSDAYYFHDHIPGSELAIIPGAGHFAFIDYPEDVLAHISWFLHA